MNFEWKQQNFHLQGTSCLLGWDYFSYFHFMRVTVLVTFIKSLQHCFLVEAIRYDNTLNLWVIFSSFLLRMLLETEFLFRLSRHRFWERSLLLFCLDTKAERWDLSCWGCQEKLSQTSWILRTPVQHPLEQSPLPPRSCFTGSPFDMEHSRPWGICTLILCVTTLKSQACKHGGDECVISVWVDKNKMNC